MVKRENFIILCICVNFLPRDARNAKRGTAVVSRPSFWLSVCLSVCNVDVPRAYRLDEFELNYTSNSNREILIAEMAVTDTGP